MRNLGFLNFKRRCFAFLHEQCVGIDERMDVERTVVARSFVRLGEFWFSCFLRTTAFIFALRREGNGMERI